MPGGWTVVLDIGKSLSKASLWDETGALITRRLRPNAPVEADCVQLLDVDGIEQWLREVLADFATRGPVDAIIPVAHGAAAALIDQGRLQGVPLDYEWPGVAAERAEYDKQRDSFAVTGSPALPAGLNLGMQLHWWQSRGDVNFESSSIVPWPQYWAWVLCGTTACEVSSLGCHTDLWRPFERIPSNLAIARGWADRLAPLHPAHAVLDTIKPTWSKNCGLSSQVQVLCGLHDSNAALLSARTHPEIHADSATLSTGTWFVAMRSAAKPPGNAALPEGRDCLVNVDVAGQPVPSARFMGGREIELMTSANRQDDDRSDPAAQIRSATQAIERCEMILPTAVRGVGPFPNAKAQQSRSVDPALAEVYAALVADVSLNLIGGCESLVVEGRFARSAVFTRTLASLRSETRVWVSDANDGVAQGALSLLKRSAPSRPLRLIKPLDVDMGAYRRQWREAVGQLEHSA